MKINTKAFNIYYYLNHIGIRFWQWNISVWFNKYGKSNFSFDHFSGNWGKIFIINFKKITGYFSTRCSPYETKIIDVFDIKGITYK